MVRVIKFLIVGGILFFFISLSIAIETPETIEMKDSLGKSKNPTYSPVVFPHKKHEKFDCKDCHHKWTDENTPPQKCTSSGCHDVFNAKGKQMREPKSSYFAFHDRKSKHSCIGCHTKNKRKKLATGPIVCKQCHIKK